MLYTVIGVDLGLELDIFSLVLSDKTIPNLALR